MAKLTQEAIETRLADLSEWTRSNDTIQRTFAFGNFREAMAFVNKVADVAEQVEHHPGILIRYNKVTLTLTTHDAGGLTEKDFDFAAAMDDLMGVRAS